jgi:hypothetical protein
MNRRSRQGKEIRVSRKTTLSLLFLIGDCGKVEKANHASSPKADKSGKGGGGKSERKITNRKIRLANEVAAIES